MKHDAYNFAKIVDQQIEILSKEEYILRSNIKNSNNKISNITAKKLLEEALPLSRLALLLKQPGLNVSVELFEDTGRADGHISINGFQEKDFEVQMTYAGYGHEESLRAEMLLKHGYAPGSGQIKRKDKSTQEIIANMCAEDIDSHQEKISKAVAAAFEKKNAKSYAPRTALVISFYEINFSGISEWALLFKKIKKITNMHESNFSSIYLFNAASNEIYRTA